MSEKMQSAEWLSALERVGKEEDGFTVQYYKYTSEVGFGWTVSLWLDDWSLAVDIIVSGKATFGEAAEEALRRYAEVDRKSGKSV